MNLLIIYRYIKGYITVKVYGGFKERFINLCALKGINLWDTEYKNGCLYTKLYAKDFKKLRKIVKSSGVRIDIIDKQGIYFLIKRHKSRRGLIYSAIFFIVFVIIMSRFVWNIEVSGSEKISDEIIIAAAEEYGLKNGTFIPFFDENELSRNMINHFKGDVLWLAVNIKGSKAVIEVRDFVEEKMKETDTEPCNIIADFDGIILSTESYKGQMNVKAGNAVKKGDILISGVMENDDLSSNYCNAEGKITALHNEIFEIKYSTSNKAEILSVTDTFYNMNIFGIRIPLSAKAFKRNENPLNYRTYFEISNIKLPFYIEKNVIYQINNTKTNNDDILFSVDKFILNEFQEKKNTTVLKRKYSISANETSFVFKSAYYCIDFMGEKQEIIKEN
ncbi:MAG: sporulation protein YqfD [Acutalibacteraceae bacterium]